MPKSILKRTRKKTPGKRSRRRVRIKHSGSSASKNAVKQQKKSGKKKIKRPYSTGAKHKRRRAYRRFMSHPVHGARAVQEMESLNFLMKNLLDSQVNNEYKHYDPRHYRRRPEYAGASGREQEYMRDNPLPDFNMTSQKRNQPIYI
jgi:hypothetical protein